MAAPSKPTILSVTQIEDPSGSSGSNYTLQVEFQYNGDLTNMNFMLIQGYGGTTQVYYPATTAIVRNVPAGVQNLIATAYNTTDGPSVASDAFPITVTAGAMVAPSNVVVVFNEDRSVDVSWDMPSGADIDWRFPDYTYVRFFLDGNSRGTGMVTADRGVTPPTKPPTTYHHAAGQLEPGTYSVQVSYGSPSGGSGESPIAEVQLVVPPTVPTAPVILMAFVEGGKLYLWGEAPYNTGGAAIDEFRLVINESITLTSPTMWGLSQFAADLSGVISPGIDLLIELSAHNSVGYGPADSTTRVMTMATPALPSAPEVILGVAGDPATEAYLNLTVQGSDAWFYEVKLTVDGVDTPVSIPVPGLTTHGVMLSPPEALPILDVTTENANMVFAVEVRGYNSTGWGPAVSAVAGETPPAITFNYMTPVNPFKAVFDPAQGAATVQEVMAWLAGLVSMYLSDAGFQVFSGDFQGVPYVEFSPVLAEEVVSQTPKWSLRFGNPGAAMAYTGASSFAPDEDDEAASCLAEVTFTPQSEFKEEFFFTCDSKEGTWALCSFVHESATVVRPNIWVVGTVFNQPLQNQQDLEVVASFGLFYNGGLMVPWAKDLNDAQDAVIRRGGRSLNPFSLMGGGTVTYGVVVNPGISGWGKSMSDILVAGNGSTISLPMAASTLKGLKAATAFGWTPWEVFGNWIVTPMGADADGLPYNTPLALPILDGGFSEESYN